MRILIAAACGALVCSVPAQAAEKSASAAQIKSIAVGHDVNSGGAVLHYGADGSYTYNGQYPGKYKISTGQICVSFDAGGKRCDKIVVDGTSYSLINKDGQRFSFGQ